MCGTGASSFPKVHIHARGMGDNGGSVGVAGDGAHGGDGVEGNMPQARTLREAHHFSCVESSSVVDL